MCSPVRQNSNHPCSNHKRSPTVRDIHTNRHTHTHTHTKTHTHTNTHTVQTKYTTFHSSGAYVSLSHAVGLCANTPWVCPLLTFFSHFFLCIFFFLLKVHLY